MSETTRRKAAETVGEIEALQQMRSPAPVDPAELEGDPVLAGEIARLADGIDITDTHSIVGFGSAAQGELQKISQTMLADVRSKDVGPAGDSLREIVSTLRGFSVSELDIRRKRSWWEKLTGKMAPMARFVARYESVQSQIDDITGSLLAHEHALLKDIKALDRLYEQTLAFYRELALYIAAGERKLAQVDGELAELAAQGEPVETDMLAAQRLRDLRAGRDDLERRIHDLRLTRQVTMQSLPSIRLVQENDKSLVTKINSTLVNTVPLWETQLAQAVTIQRSREAAGAVREANDLTNELLTSNARNLREANSEVRREIERGVFDIEAVNSANADLIATIEESLDIADEGRARRAAAEQELARMEDELKQSLAAASGRAARDPGAPPAGTAGS
ncbi:toxic anion resistance protein [Profundibacterium mesophilum]|uniref:Tellurite resistance protein n=1 Tax=Profundibacterium mesophilum KAUST100406-0324 TaxID=1037889 RepID=A0A921NS19_9RHOB|nr:toxic anion resistance protein [Profundibacterium mesophilum]KAF0675379.1 Tellurite resistance protein [Profundibacterium mesophilum KAUST100406-0324]